MKTLTIKNPWATLIVEGLKEYEFRSYKTNYRGKILIHTSKVDDKKSINKFKKYNLNYRHGAIIGEATLTDCILVDKEFDNKLKEIDPDVYRSNHFKKTYAWKLENIKKYDKPIYAKGNLGLWNYEEKSYEEIETPQELYYFMKNNIKYGIHGTDGKDYFPGEDFEWANRNVYKLADENKMLKYKIGHCWDQVELERAWFKKHNYEFKTVFIWFCLDYENPYPTHTYLVYKEKNKWHLFEHADYANQGIKSFNTFEDAVRYQRKKQIITAEEMGLEMNNKIKNSLRMHEYNIKKHEISADKFVSDIIENSKEITKQI